MFKNRAQKQSYMLYYQDGLNIIITSIQPEGRFLAGTRAQSGDRYGSGTLHSRQFLRSRLPLLSPAFRPSHFRL